MGARAYRLLAEHEPDPGAVVEVGSERGEGSTAWLDAWARSHRCRFYSADIDPDTHERARAITDGARLCPGATLIRRLALVSVAYLDGFDWTPDDPHFPIDGYIARYAELGYQLTNHNAQAAMLDEAYEVVARASPNCLVICDDTWRTGSGWDGKGGRAVPYLLGYGRFRQLVEAGPGGDSLGFVMLRREATG